MQLIYILVNNTILVNNSILILDIFSNCVRSFHKIALLYPKVLFRNSVLGFVSTKSVLLFEQGYMHSDLHFFCGISLLD